jgi:eukaryotic-like serine/threonine-protein kinase
MSNIKNYKEHWSKVDDIAGGGQGTTIKALNIQDKQTISAVKILNKQNDLERRARMQRETVALITLSHPNLPKVLDTNTEFWQNTDYKLFIATEFIPGSTLSNFDFSTINLNHKIELIINISKVIHYCHQRGVIHRDIKPDNIILKNNSISAPIVIDFGISFNFNEKDDDNLTPDGQHLGNRFLILPEQKVGEVGKRDFRTDISCLVGLFYYFLTNQLPTIAIDEYNQKPHQRDSAKEIIDYFPKHQKDVINYIFDVGFNQLIDKRWQTVQSFIEQLILLQKAEPIIMDSTNKFVDLIKSKTAQQDYQDTKYAKQLFDMIDKYARQVLEKLQRELGDDWGYSQSGAFLNGEFAYKNMLSPSNRINTNLKTNTTIYGFITGNELVIQLLEGNNKYEALRQPILGDINWGQFKEILKRHYLKELAKLI